MALNYTTYFTKVPGNIADTIDRNCYTKHRTFPPKDSVKPNLTLYKRYQKLQQHRHSPPPPLTLLPPPLFLLLSSPLLPRRRFVAASFPATPHKAVDGPSSGSARFGAAAAAREAASAQPRRAMPLQEGHRPAAPGCAVPCAMTAPIAQALCELLGPLADPGHLARCPASPSQDIRGGVLARLPA